MKPLLMVLLLVATGSLFAEDRFPFPYPFPERAVFGFVGCGLDGTVKFVDVVNDTERLAASALVDEPCLEVLDALSWPPSVKVGPAVAARVARADGTIPDDIEQSLVFRISGRPDAKIDVTTLEPLERGFSISGRGTKALLVCELADGMLRVRFTDGELAEPPQAGDACTDKLYRLRAAGNRIDPPLAAALGGRSTAETQVEECLIFELTAGGVEPYEPSAQLVCDYGLANNLVVAGFHCLPGECDGVDVNPGDSCPVALKKIEAIIRNFKITEPKTATPNMTLIYPIWTSQPVETP